MNYDVFISNSFNLLICVFRRYYPVCVNLSITILEQTILDIYGIERKQEVISCSSLDN